MAEVDDSLIHLIHTIWSAGLTAALAAIGWILRWNWTRLVQQVDLKAEKETVRELAEHVDSKADHGSFADFKNDMERRHNEHLTALHEIRAAIERNDSEATQMRTALQATMQQLVGQVGKIEGWIVGQSQTGKS